jgi:hypothetical protein
MDHTLSYRRSINFKLGRLVLIAVGIGLALVAGLGVWHETGRYTTPPRSARRCSPQRKCSAPQARAR